MSVAKKKAKGQSTKAKAPKVLTPEDVIHFREDSLFKRLGEENRQQVYAWLTEDGLGPEKIAEKIQSSLGITTSPAAVSEMARRCGLGYRLTRATRESDAQAAMLPADMEARTRQRLRQQYYDAIFENLSRKELLAFMQFELSEKQHEANVAHTQKQIAQKDTALKQKDRALQQSERRVKLLEANAQEAKKLLTDATKKVGKGTTAETIRRIEEAARLL